MSKFKYYSYYPYAVYVVSDDVYHEICEDLDMNCTSNGFEFLSDNNSKHMLIENLQHPIVDCEYYRIERDLKNIL